MKSARVRGKNLTELDAEELGRQVGHLERFQDLLKFTEGLIAYDASCKIAR